MTPKILFICKIRNDFYGPSFGLINSCRFTANALKAYGIDCKVVSVIDNNCIDKEVSEYQPTHVFIEALWVLPSKFEELIPLYPTVKWYVRVHSKIPFIANEGMAIEWLREYAKLSEVYDTLSIAANCEEVVRAFEVTYGINTAYFPNIYCPPAYDCSDSSNSSENILNIGCFGAIRPMKNQLNQALAAITFGNEIGMKVHFHINSDRCETGGDPVLKNIVYAFKGTQHKLIYHPWLSHDNFINIVRQMDLGLQVSLSETFNIVSADFVWNDIPLIGSPEISWLDKNYKADPHNIDDIVSKTRRAYKGIYADRHKVNRCNLENYNRKATKVWLETL